jgi:multiple sugar transport system substrate-binding protein
VECELEGITWDDPRGYGGLEASTTAYGLRIRWRRQSLRDFTMAPPGELAERYDLVVVDYPSMGNLASSGKFLSAEEILGEPELREVREGAVGPTFRSYSYGGRTWALPLDASAQVSAYRPDLLPDPPRTIESAMELARRSAREGSPSVAVPLAPLHAHSTFLTLLYNSNPELTGRPFHSLEDSALIPVLERMRTMADHLHPISFRADAIILLDEMSRKDEISYSPFIYGYFNYSRPSYREKLVLFGDIPSSGYMPFGAVLGGAGIAISRRSLECLKEVRGFLRWLLSSEAQRTTYVEGGGQPYHVRAWIDAEVNWKFNDAFLKTLPTLTHAYVRPNFPGYTEAHERSGKVILSFLEGNGKAGEVTRDLKRIFRESYREES